MSLRTPSLEQAISQSPDAARAQQYWHEALKNLNLSDKDLDHLIPILTPVFSTTQGLSEFVLNHPSTLDLLKDPEYLSYPRSLNGLMAGVNAELDQNPSGTDPLITIRRFKHQENFRIAVRDLTGKASLEETTLELSNLAEVCLQQVTRLSLQKFNQQLGVPRCESSGKPAGFTILGMGKLGGYELNYSSDIDVIFIYEEEGIVHRNNRKSNLSNHQFFNRVGEEIVREVGRMTSIGNLFRIDLRLRPEGNSGPLTRSLDSCEIYYSQWGQVWERLALIKARRVAGDQKVADLFFESIHTYRYPRYMSESLIGEIAAIKKRIEIEIVGQEEMHRHVKLGYGGIREIEFIVQCLQLLNAGKVPFLQCANTLETLHRLADYEILPRNVILQLQKAYRLLRMVEHRLQMEANLQTHSLPKDPSHLLRLAKSLGFENVESFNNLLQNHRENVRKVYDELIQVPADKVKDAGSSRIASDLQRAGFKDLTEAKRTLNSLVQGPGFVHVSSRTKELFQKLQPHILENSRRLADPDRALKLLERFVEGYGSRASLFETFLNNPRLLDLILKLADRSPYYMEALIRRPELFEEVTRGNVLPRTWKSSELLVELRNVPEHYTTEDWLRIFVRAESLRLALRDILGLVNLDAWFYEMSILAEAAAIVALQHSQTHLKIKSSAFALIGMGKFGGNELSYGADLDVIYLADATPQKLMAYKKLAAQFARTLSAQTSEGSAFPVDPRLRPDGEKGELVASMQGLKDYYQKQAQTWEKQALLKARFIAGNSNVGKEFNSIRDQILFAAPPTPEQLQEIWSMKQRIEKERGTAESVEHDLKTGPGGIIEIEFLTQAMQWKWGHQHAALRGTNTLQCLVELKNLGLLSAENHEQLRESYLFQRRIENCLRLFNNKPVSSLPEDEGDLRSLVKWLEMDSPATFLEIYHNTRQTSHQISRQWFEQTV